MEYLSVESYAEVWISPCTMETNGSAREKGEEKDGTALTG
jgi:hypothetical protein